MQRSWDIRARCRTNQHDLKANARSCFSNYQRLAYKISAYEMCIICPKLFVACKIHCKSPSRRPDGLTMLDWFTVHEANLSAYVSESAYVRNHVGCWRVHQTLLLHVPQIFQRHKSDANKQDFEIKLNLTYWARSTPHNNRDLNRGIWHLWPKFGDPSRQAQNMVNFDFEVKFDLVGQGQSPPPKIGILTKVFYTYGPNLVILAWMGNELSHGQASAYRTHGRTDDHTCKCSQRQYPKAKTGLR